MQYEVEINGRPRRVAVARDRDRFTVTIDGRTFHVDAARVDGHLWSLLIDDEPAREAAGPSASYEVSVTADAASARLAVRVGSTSIVVGLNGRRRDGTRGAGAQPGAGPQRVTAPMPGKIVRVLVRGGDAVAARQPLVVVEAMKMENELRAARPGTVAEVHAREGQSVDAGALLVLIQ